MMAKCEPWKSKLRANAKPSDELLQKMHQTIKKVSGDLPTLSYNTGSGWVTLG